MPKCTDDFDVRWAFVADVFIISITATIDVFFIIVKYFSDYFTRRDISSMISFRLRWLFDADDDADDPIMDIIIDSNAMLSPLMKDADADSQTFRHDDISFHYAIIASRSRWAFQP